MTTNISWTDETYNPIVGCSRISAGCANCYAATASASARLQQFPQYQQVKDWDGTVEFVESQLLKPLSWKKPKRIFVCSMSDLFHENVPDEWRDRIFAVMAMCPQHTFQVLTKRPENALKYLSQDNLKSRWRMQSAESSFYNVLPKDFKTGYFKLNSHWDELNLPLNNVWVGTTVENQAMADIRIPILLQIPAKVRFLSCEPLLEEININLGSLDVDYDPDKGTTTDVFVPNNALLNWVIIGGESGKDSRPCHTDWVRSLVRQCQSADVPVFVKQMGSNPVGSSPYIDGVDCVNYFVKLRDRKGGDISAFPEDLQIREFPNI